jgi:flotillin
MTVISNDGASQLSKNVSSGVQETAQMLKDTTGFDVIEMLSGFGKSRPAEAKRTNDGAVDEPARTAVVMDTAKDK